MIDSQSVKTASVAEERGIDGEKIKGRKRHIVVDTMGNLPAVIVHAANIHDTKSSILAAKDVFEKYPSVQRFRADAGYRITREQLAVMFWRYVEKPAAVNKNLNFADAEKVSDYALNALCWAVENGVINSKGNNVLDPQGLATRAQTAQILKNFWDK